MKLEGEIVSYISHLSREVFTNISRTCKEYQQAFSDPAMMSGMQDEANSRKNYV
jgi:hypothetical protein